MLVVLAFMLFYPVQRFGRATFDRRVRWRLLGIRWTALLAAFVTSVVWQAWNERAGGNTTTILVSYGILAAFYGLGEWLVRRHLKASGIEVQETIRGGTY